MASKKKLVLEVTKRENLGSAASRRDIKGGKVPAVVYGHGATPKHLLMDAKQWSIISKQDAQIIELKPNTGDNLSVLIKEVQSNFLTEAPTHVDFLEVKMDEMITAFVPIHGHGTPIGTTQGGVLEQEMHEIEINCTPLTLPESIDVELSDLELGSSIHTSTLPFPEGVTAVSDVGQIVFQVALPQAEEEEPDSESGETLAEGEEAGTQEKSEEAKEGSK